MRVLLIEDDPVLGDGLSTGLSQEDHTVEWLDDGRLATDALAAATFDVAVLDLALPGRSGLQVLKDWRAAGETIPVLVLTAYADVEDRITGLDSGADDYLGKPVAISELAARVRALTRRGEGHCDNLLRCGPVCLDRSTGNATFGDQPVALSHHELVLLEALLSRPGQTISRAHLESRLYGWDDGPESNSLEVHIHHLRNKLGSGRIATVRGMGYRLTADEP